MKTIKKNGNYERLKDAEAREKVRVAGWAFCPKSEWKQNVRDISKTEAKKLKNA